MMSVFPYLFFLRGGGGGCGGVFPTKKKCRFYFQGLAWLVVKTVRVGFDGFFWGSRLVVSGE